MKNIILFTLLPVVALTSCGRNQSKVAVENQGLTDKVNGFAEFRLTADLSTLSGNERRMIPLLIEVARIMDDIFWMEAYGNRDELMASLNDEAAGKLVMINYGPWERLNGNAPFLEGFGPKPAGANFYPHDMTKEEFDKLSDPDKTSLYTFIRRDDSGNLIVVPYHQELQEQMQKASALLLQAAELADDPGLKKYLQLRAQAFLDDDYYPSDLAWMDMKTNVIDFVAGPIESYEDQLYGYKAAHEAFILIKDAEWSARLEKYTSMLPSLQGQLPVEPRYKTEVPGGSSDLGVYDAVYYAGDCNAGSKTIAINLPNDARVQSEKGSRRLQLKNAMQAKFDKIMKPIAANLMGNDSSNVIFDAFFTNVMFHEIAHGLGCNLTINGTGTVRDALREHYSTLEEGKADILGLFLVTYLNETGVVDVSIENSYKTFMAGIFRSVRFGASSAHGKANLICFNYFREKEAFIVDDAGNYRVNTEKMKEAMTSLANMIITIQGDGDYDRASWLINTYGVMDSGLQRALDKIAAGDIPVDIVFEQGREVLGL